MAERKPLTLVDNRPGELPASDNLPYTVLPQAWTHPALGAPLGSMLVYAAIARGASPPDTFAFWATETNEASTDALVTITGVGYLGFDLVNSDRARENLGLGDVATLDVEDLISEEPGNALEFAADGKLLVPAGGGGTPDIRIPFAGITDGDMRVAYVRSACSIRGVVGLFGPTTGDADVDIIVDGYSAYPPSTVEHSFSVTAGDTYKSSALAIGIAADSVIGVAFSNLSAITEGEIYLQIGPALGTEHKFWRIYITATSHVVAAIAEMELRSTPGGANIATGGTATASSVFDGASGAANAFDGNNTSYWASSIAGFPPAWLAYELSAQAEVNQVAIRARTSGGEIQAPRDFVIQSSEDGIVWSNEWSVSGSSGWGAGEQRIFTRP